MIPQITSLFTLIVTLSPFFVSVFLVLQSFAKNNLQGIVYLCGVILAESFGYLIRPIFGNMGVRPDIVQLVNGERYIERGRACNIIDDPWMSPYSCPDFNAIFHSFTIIYIFGSDLKSGEGGKNLGLLLSFILLYVMDMLFRLSNKCIFLTHWIVGTFVGIICGYLWFLFVGVANDGKLLYNSKMSDKKSCTVIDSKLKCTLKIYKKEDGGEWGEVPSTTKITPANMVSALTNSS
tara:strand:- start:1516 stop:2220 length:705 start_codon:yes stop_codon:yes gene_type:complete